MQDNYRQKAAKAEAGRNDDIETQKSKKLQELESEYHSKQQQVEEIYDLQR